MWLSVAVPGPVISGDFSDGEDEMLWNPQLSPGRWRRYRLRGWVSVRSVLGGLCGAGLIGAAVAWAPGIAIETGAIIVGLFVLGLAAVHGADRADSLATEHRHHGCRLERSPGEFFLRGRDCVVPGGPLSDRMATMIGAVHRLHTRPARVWLDPAVPREAHRVVWEVFMALRDTRSARYLVRQHGAEPDEVIAMVSGVLGAVDDAVDRIAFALDGCVVLLQAWESKLRRAELTERVDTTLSVLDADSLAKLMDAAEALPQNVFAWVTAARDVLDAGDFGWEHSSVPDQAGATRAGCEPSGTPVSAYRRVNRSDHHDDDYPRSGGGTR